MNLPGLAYYGQFIKWQKEDNIEDIFFDGAIPSNVDEKTWFAAVGLNEPNSVWVTGVFKEHPKSFLAGSLNFFFTPKTPFFAHRIELIRPFPEKKNKLRLPSSVWKKVSAPDPKREEYRKKIKKLWKNEASELPKTCWSVPLNSRINSQFGKPRDLPDGRRYFHSGVDLRAREGTPLPAISEGKVVFAEEALVPGKTVIVYHGEGIHSQYMHMSKIDVSVGQMVSGGDLLGLSGSTGRVEGPHLHWEIHWKGRKASPFSFLESVGNACPHEST